MTPTQHQTLLLHRWERILERAGVRRDETEAYAAELWQALRGHGGRLTWLPDDPATQAAHQPAQGDHSAAAAAVRAEVRPTPTVAQPEERQLLLGIPPWQEDHDADQT